MAETEPASTQQTLSFPPLQFAKLSPRPFLHAHLSRPNPTRPNGRSPSSHRPSAIHTSALSSTNVQGSAVVRHGNTSCVAGVTAEILKAEDVGAYRISTAESETPTERTSSDAGEIAKLTLLVPNIELNTGCNPAYLPGGPPSTLAQSLSHRLLTLCRIGDLVAFDDLKIWHRREPGAVKGSSTTRQDDAMDVEDQNDADDEVKDEVKGFWVLYIDIVFLSLDGSAFDVAWLALLAALKSTRLPSAKWDADMERIICSPLEEDKRVLTLKSFPVPLTSVVFSYDSSGLIGADGVTKGDGMQRWVLEDADDFEESCCEESITVVVDERRVLRIERGGGGSLDGSDVKALCGRAGERWVEWRKLLRGKVEGGGIPGSLAKQK